LSFTTISPFIPVTAPALNSATNCDLISSNKYGEN